jgi:hypothetical protein
LHINIREAVLEQQFSITGIANAGIYSSNDDNTVPPKQMKMSFWNSRKKTEMKSWNDGTTKRKETDHVFL